MTTYQVLRRYVPSTVLGNQIKLRGIKTSRPTAASRAQLRSGVRNSMANQKSTEHVRWLSSKPKAARDAMLKELDGQKIRIPDLGKLMQSFLGQFSPHVEAVRSRILGIIATHTVNDSVRKRLLDAMLPECLVGYYPFASQDRIGILASFQAWMYIVDDMIDQYSSATHFDLEALEILLRDSQEFIEHTLNLHNSSGPGPIRYKHHETVTSFELYGNAVAQAYRSNPAYRARVAREAIATLHAYLQEARSRYDGNLPTIDGYLEYRQSSSCMNQVVTNFELANEISLPEDVATSAELRQMYSSAVRATWIVNDIVSLRKEIKEGFVENLVVLYCDGDAQQGLDRTVERLKTELDLLCAASDAAVKRFSGTEFDESVVLLAKNCKNLCMSNWLWSMKTPRYCLFDIEPDADGSYSFLIESS